MIPQQVIAKICNEERRNAPFFKHLNRKLALNLSDIKYAAFAYQFNTCFLLWLLSQLLETLYPPCPFIIHVSPTSVIALRFK